MSRKWEYKLEYWKPGWRSGDLPAVEKQLNMWGGEGWELVKFEWVKPDDYDDVSCRMLFKRPLEE